MSDKKTGKGDGYLYKVGGVYYVEFKVDGKRIKRSLKTTSKVAAEKARREMAKTFQMRDKLDLVREVATAKKIIEEKVEIALDAAWNYHTDSGINQISEKSANTRKSAWNSFIRYMSSEHMVVYIHDITEAHLIDYFNHRSSEIAKSTYDSQKISIRHILSTCKVSTELLDAKIWNRKVKDDTDKPRRTGFTLKEAQHIMDNISGEEMRDIFTFAFFVGTRAVDSCPMTWDKIDLKFRTLTYTPSKTRESSGKKMTIPLLKPVYEMLVRRKLESNSEYVFPEMRRLYEDCANGRFQLEVRKALKEIGIEPQQKYNGRNYAVKSFHSCRYTVASMYSNLGIPRVICQEILGHSSEEINLVYTNTDTEYIRTYMQKFEDEFEKK